MKTFAPFTPLAEQYVNPASRTLSSLEGQGAGTLISITTQQYKDLQVRLQAQNLAAVEATWGLV